MSIASIQDFFTTSLRGIRLTVYWNFVICNNTSYIRRSYILWQSYLYVMCCGTCISGLKFPFQSKRIKCSTFRKVTAHCIFKFPSLFISWDIKIGVLHKRCNMFCVVCDLHTSVSNSFALSTAASTAMPISVVNLPSLGPYLFSISSESAWTFGQQLFASGQLLIDQKGKLYLNWEFGQVL